MSTGQLHRMIVAYNKAHQGEYIAPPESTFYEPVYPPGRKLPTPSPSKKALRMGSVWEVPFALRTTDEGLRYLSRIY